MSPHFISAPEIDAAPLLLGRICSDWRNISQGAVELWTSLKVDWSDIPVALIETWLLRAWTMPLTLELKLPPIFNDDEEEVKPKGPEWDGAKKKVFIALDCVSLLKAFRPLLV
ncbi:hypothetical protein K438DRAFT_1970627 [Mycena galopus ATCC 62051]|nr:hypothetical protein K438DRAFT_1970627 [Mycena galopus ATCC 62051]